MIAGDLVDVSFPDLLQFLHLSARSGTLYLERGDETAYISFHNGRLASAWCPTSITVVGYLEENGLIRPGEIAKARALHERDAARRSLGQILLALGAVSQEDLRLAVARKIEQTVYELLAWRRGKFRFVVEEVRHDEELLFEPRDVVLQVDLDTQAVLLDALRLSDERTTVSRPSLTDAAARAVAASKARAAAEPARGPGAVRIDVVTPDAELGQGLAGALAHLGLVRLASWRDAGALIDDRPATLAVCDARNDPAATERLARFHRDHPRCVVVAVVGDLESSRRAYLAGATAVAPADPPAIDGCCTNLLAATTRSATTLAAGVTDTFAPLRGFYADIRSGLAASKLSVNLMAMVARSADRGVLLAARRDTLVALTAFGRSADGGMLAEATRGLRVLLEAGGPFARSFEAGHALGLDWDSDEIPDGFRMVLDRPAAGRGIILPIQGARRMIAVIYADNGARTEALADLELLELAAGQFGLAIENEILRRQIDR